MPTTASHAIFSMLASKRRHSGTCAKLPESFFILFLVLDAVINTKAKKLFSFLKANKSHGHFPWLWSVNLPSNHCCSDFSFNIRFTALITARSADLDTLEEIPTPVYSWPLL